ncbi:MAG: hypothetical protein Q7T97_04365 [Burkholderiaceae bacterium]|nr:hypothetical protein [Burkholderiaceae bacterium]
MSLFGWFNHGGPSTTNARSRTALRSPSFPAEADWTRVRQPLRPQDLVLSALARRWQASLANHHRPDHLCAMYPRVANRLALCWDDSSLASKVLDELVVDKRRGRAGFPPAVSQELIQLRLLRPAPQRPSDFTPLWDPTNMACGDRGR